VIPRFTAPRPAGHRAASKRDSSLPGPPAVPGHSAPQVGQLPGPPRARPWWGFCAVAVTLFAMMLSATLPTALYATYANRFGFGPGTLTLIFAVYVAGILAVLVLLGDLADRIGYRTVLLAAVLPRARRRPDRRVTRQRVRHRMHRHHGNQGIPGPAPASRDPQNR
jgi:hypothetical protein